MRYVHIFLAVPFVIGILLILWVYGPENIASSHSDRAYLMLCTGLLCIVIGCLGVVVRSRDGKH